uniref:Uncharacterized protein n=1 Tax=Pavo cristatus TaxID=9049 RepID=A0A8C9LCR7_PAVCR
IASMLFVILLDLCVDRELYFRDTYSFYQFSADECTYLFCEFEKEGGWKNAVKLLLQLLPLSPPRIDIRAQEFPMSAQSQFQLLQKRDLLLARSMTSHEQETALQPPGSVQKEGRRCSRRRAEALCSSGEAWSRLSSCSPWARCGATLHVQPWRSPPGSSG